MSVWTELVALEAQKELDKKGLQVFVKSSVSPEIKIYDSDNKNMSTGAGASLVDVGVTLRNRNGNMITNYGGVPDTNYLLAGSLTVLAFMVIFFFVRGVVK